MNKPLEKATMADNINIPHLARLARLSLDAQAQTQAAEDLQNIIAMIDAMQAIPTDGVEPMAHPLDATQRLRKDEVSEDVARAQFQAVAPSTEDGYYLVPRVVE
jgi:aspartyl-tRNA(Asn)/glutamyl-tRNA(Gln) amidotransferase subunit C